MTPILIFLTHGLSMLPSICDGQSIKVDTSYSIENVRAGDIIVFRDITASTGNTSHRVYEVHKNWLWTKGDNNAKADSVRVTKNNYIGKVTCIITAQK